jgi:hypothetical protein
MEVLVMSRVRLSLLFAASLLALGAVTAASASATARYLVCVEEKGGKYANHECKEEGGGKDWEKKAIRSGEGYAIASEGGPSELETGKFTIKCEVDKNEFGELKGAGTSLYYIEFRSCTVVGKKACTVSNYALSLEGVLGNTVVEDPGGPVTFIELTLLSGSEATITGCGVAGTYKFKGKQMCRMPELQEMKEEHEIICQKGGSEIEVEGGEKGVKFADTEDVFLKSDDYWGAEI